MKMTFASLFVLSLLLISSTLLDVANAAQYSPAPTPGILSPPAQPSSPSGGFCGQKCGVRCSKAGKRSRCLRYCLMCCERCKCVPSGTYGNKDECPCYRDWKSPNNGKPKCP